jgi:hypothetical protein
MNFNYSVLLHGWNRVYARVDIRVVDRAVHSSVWDHVWGRIRLFVFSKVWREAYGRAMEEINR